MESFEAGRGLTCFGDMYIQYKFMLWLHFDMFELSATAFIEGEVYFVEEKKL
jgi:hypothetical protein